MLQRCNLQQKVFLRKNHSLEIKLHYRDKKTWWNWKASEPMSLPEQLRTGDTANPNFQTYSKTAFAVIIWYYCSLPPRILYFFSKLLFICQIQSTYRFSGSLNPNMISIYRFEASVPIYVNFYHENVNFYHENVNFFKLCKTFFLDIKTCFWRVFGSQNSNLSFIFPNRAYLSRLYMHCIVPRITF